MRVLPLLGGTCFVLSRMPLWSVDIALRPLYRLKYKRLAEILLEKGEFARPLPFFSLQASWQFF